MAQQRPTLSIIVLAATAVTLTLIFSVAFYLHPLAAGVFAGTFAAIAIVVRAIADAGQGNDRETDTREEDPNSASSSEVE